MQRVRVKIEGLREPATARKIAQMGADAIGLVLAESPRRVTVEQARAVVAAVPPWVATVGVFVDAPPAEINDVTAQTGIGYVQLHGDEPPEALAAIERPCIKAFRVREEGSLAGIRAWLDAAGPAANLAAVLLDAYDPHVRGGSGQRFNWDLVAPARRADWLAPATPMILAGGLGPDCVAEAVRTVQPWAVDVASGVESAPGVKDLAKVEAFLAAAAEAGPLGEAFWR